MHCNLKYDNLNEKKNEAALPVRDGVIHCKSAVAC